jgi:hypothetical protein
MENVKFWTIVVEKIVISVCESRVWNTNFYLQTRQELVPHLQAGVQTQQNVKGLQDQNIM